MRLDLFTTKEKLEGSKLMYIFFTKEARVRRLAAQPSGVRATLRAITTPSDVRDLFVRYPVYLVRYRPLHPSTDVCYSCDDMHCYRLSRGGSRIKQASETPVLPLSVGVADLSGCPHILLPRKLIVMSVPPSTPDEYLRVPRSSRRRVEREERISKTLSVRIRFTVT